MERLGSEDEMSTEFWIQAGEPRLAPRVTRQATTIDEAIEEIFLRETEDAIIVWRQVCIPLSYKYDVGTILVDILAMVRALSSGTSGTWQVDWPSNTFSARWHFAWQDNRLTVTASEWWATVGDTEELLRARACVTIDKTDFLCEWKKVLVRVCQALRASGYSPKEFVQVTELESTIARIPHFGVLYR